MSVWEKDLVALVTGGASGIGKACVRKLDELGVKVIIADLPSSNGEDLVKALSKRAEFFPTDVTGEDNVKRLVEHIAQKHQRLHILINCAGIADFSPIYDFEKNTPHPSSVFNRIMQVNLFGTFNVTRFAAGVMGKNEPLDSDGFRGVIINFSSVAAFEAPANLVAYNASKAAIASMTLTLSRELGSRGIRVVGLVPGGVDTPMTVDENPNPTKDFFKAKTIASMTFPKRYAQPEEIAQVVQFVVENKMMNGEIAA